MFAKLRRRPTQVVLETTNRCNLNCPFCLVGRQDDLLEEHGNAAHSLMKRDKGSMSHETFEIVKRELQAFGAKKVYLHFQGEPMLNELTPAFAQELKKDGFEVGIFTNGQAFTDERIQTMADAGVDLIRFSVDGASEGTYQQNRPGGRFKDVLANMEKLVAAHKGKRTRIEWQFLAMRNNEHEIAQAESLATQIGVHFFVKGFRETDPALAPVNPELKSKQLKKPCKDIYKQLGIYWNGDVVPCCYDVDAMMVMGNVHEAPLLDIWNGETYKQFRGAVDRAKKHPSEEPKLCQSCLRWS